LTGTPLTVTVVWFNRRLAAWPLREECGAGEPFDVVQEELLARP
jgi:hypothetical protein